MSPDVPVIEYQTPAKGCSKFAIATVTFAAIAMLCDLRNLIYWNSTEYDRYELLFGSIFGVSWLLAILFSIAFRARRKQDRLMKQIALGLLALQLFLLALRQ